MNKNTQNDQVDSTYSEKSIISLPIIAGLVPGASLLVSVVHEWAYFSVINPDLIRLMTISDYFSSILKWLPGTVIAMFVGYAALFITRRIEGGMTEEELISTSSAPRFTRLFRAASNNLLRLMVLVGIPYAVITLPIWMSSFIGIPILVAWVYLASWVTSHERLSGWMTRRMKMAFEWLPPLIIFIAMLGSSEAAIALVAKKGDSEVILNSDTTMDVLLLRPLEVGLVVRQPETEKVIVLPWHKIAEFNHSSETLPMMTTTGCYLFGWPCKTDDSGDSD